MKVKKENSEKSKPLFWIITLERDGGRTYRTIIDQYCGSVRENLKKSTSDDIEYQARESEGVGSIQCYGCHGGCRLIPVTVENKIVKKDESNANLLHKTIHYKMA